MNEAKGNKPKLTYVGIGISKSGTTWVNRCLKEHPEVCASAEKETHFFSKNFSNGWEWYSSLYVPTDNQHVLGEFSPDYIESDEVLNKILEHYPNIKILICVRDPLDRLKSSWRFDYSRGAHNYTRFSDYINNLPQWVWSQNNYSENIGRALKLFPRENIHFIWFEEIKLQPENVLRKLYSFLGIDPDFIPENTYRKSNPSDRNYVKIRFINNFVFFIKDFLYKHKFLKPVLFIVRNLSLGKFANWVCRQNRSKGDVVSDLDDTLYDYVNTQLLNKINNESEFVNQLQR